MNIYAEHGHKVIVTEQTIKNGYNPDAAHAAQYLEVGKIYTVDYTRVSSWSTSVKLVELPNSVFNSVHFEDYEPNNIEPSPAVSPGE